MNEWAEWAVSKRLDKAARALKANGFEVLVAADLAGAADFVASLAEGAVTVGFGGSVTAVEAGLPPRLAAAGKSCLVHSQPGLTVEERVAIMRSQLICDLFVTGANAVTLDGKLVNIDATGNRVGAMTFGPKRVAVLAGANKLAADVPAALARVKELAAPPNARRLGLKTPCATTGFCSDCDSPDRICRVVHVLEKRPRLTPITVVLFPEAAGL